MSELGFPLSALASLQQGFGATSPISSVQTSPSQSFQNIPLTNSKLALYTLSIRAPNSGSLVTSFTFPLSPSSVIKEYTAMSNIYDVKGSAAQFGVQRTVDTYGNSPISYRIEGTTGWQYHSTDGFSQTGNDAIASLQIMLNQFAQYNISQQDNNSADLYTLEFYDYFSGDFWQVIPIGPQIIRQNRDRPLYFDFAFRWAGVQSLSAPMPSTQNDPVLNALSVAQPQAISTTSNSLISTLNGYQSSTLGALGTVL